MKKTLIMAMALALMACNNEQATDSQTAADDSAAPAAAQPSTSTEMADEPAMDESAETESPSLAAVLAAQSDEHKARYEHRHPQETLEFFGVEPGMTVLEGLPGGGWYSKILLPYLGPEGCLIGVDYSMEMWPLFGGFATEEFIAGRAEWPQQWPLQAREWADGSDIHIEAHTFGTIPDDLSGMADVALMVRAFHNLSRFEEQGGYLTSALADLHRVLKPGGVLGVVQHRAPADSPAEWAAGQNGYLKQDALIAAIESAGFEFVEAREINANPKDQPTAEDIVWRLPPSLNGAEEGSEAYDQAVAIGESDRMTLKFRKPAG
ncbi:MAG: class I SAM-dependent methyltransferase [Wenzhouxiangellaceae bacterium]